MKGSKAKNQKSSRQQKRDALLEEALSRPGVREFMEVYGNWQEANAELDKYHAITRELIITKTTDHANGPHELRPGSDKKHTQMDNPSLEIFHVQ